MTQKVSVLTLIIAGLLLAAPDRRRKLPSIRERS
jgi:hypothetical protein